MHDPREELYISFDFYILLIPNFKKINDAKKQAQNGFSHK